MTGTDDTAAGWRLPAASIEALIADLAGAPLSETGMIAEALQQARLDPAQLPVAQQPAELTAHRLIRHHELPHSWAAQRQLLGFT